MSKSILVTGAAGDTGYKVLKFLLEKKHDVRALVRLKDSRSAQLFLPAPMMLSKRLAVYQG